MELIIQLLAFFILLIAGYFFGTRREKRHFLSLQKREKEFYNIKISTHRKFSQPYSEVEMFTGSVVVGQDYFKTVVGSLINIFGGRVYVYETLLDRAKREAILRLKADAHKWGASEIINLKIETSSIQSGKRQKAGGACEVLVCGTGGKPLIA